jgi:hypothetical protein
MVRGQITHTAEASRHHELHLPPIEVHRSRSMNPIGSTRQERCGSTLHPQCSTAFLGNRGLFRPDANASTAQAAARRASTSMNSVLRGGPALPIHTGTYKSHGSSRRPWLRLAARQSRGVGRRPAVGRLLARREIRPVVSSRHSGWRRRRAHHADHYRKSTPRRQIPDFPDVIVIGGTSACEHRLRVRSVWG